MSIHNARKDSVTPTPGQSSCTIMHNGRGACPHAEDIAGGLQNARVDNVGRTPEEEKEKIHEYHAFREDVKKAQSQNKPPVNPPHQPDQEVKKAVTPIKPEEKK